MTGDVLLTADIQFPPAAYSHAPNPHRKADADVPPDARRGQRLCRRGAARLGPDRAAISPRNAAPNTQDIELNIAAPQTLRLEKRGDTLTMYLSMHGEPLHQVGASIKLHFDGPFYAGLGVTSHDADTTDKVVFSHVSLETPPPETAPLVEYSTLQTHATVTIRRASPQ